MLKETVNLAQQHVGSLNPADAKRRGSFRNLHHFPQEKGLQILMG
jgi:hypothetical protein